MIGRGSRTMPLFVALAHRAPGPVRIHRPIGQPTNHPDGLPGADGSSIASRPENNVFEIVETVPLVIHRNDPSAR